MREQLVYTRPLISIPAKYEGLVGDEANTHGASTLNTKPKEAHAYMYMYHII